MGEGESFKRFMKDNEEFMRSIRPGMFRNRTKKSNATISE